MSIGVFHDHHAARADVAPAVMLVPARRRKFQQIDFVAAVDVSCDRTIRNFNGLEGLLATELLFPRANDVESGELRIETEGQRGRRSRTDGICHNAKTFRIALDIIEENDLWIRRAGGDFGDRAQLQIPISAVYTAQFAKAVNGVNVFAEVFVG